MIRFRSALTVGAAVAIGAAVAGVLMPAGAGAQATASAGPAAVIKGATSFAGVAASSPASAWAVGSNVLKVLTDGQPVQRCVIGHWNGRRWRTSERCPSPGRDWLEGVTALSARRAWAVGATPPPPNFFTLTQLPLTQPLILRWNGNRWRRVPSPRFQFGGQLAAVTAVSPHHAWAVGNVLDKYGDRVGAILTWNGKTWRQTPVAALQPGHNSALAAVAATSASNAWAVGSGPPVPDAASPMILHWNGRRWTSAQLPALPFCSGNFCDLTGVAATSATNAWAVGTDLVPSQVESISVPFILHWNGRAWENVPCPASVCKFFSGLSGLNAVTAWRGRAWAAGWDQPQSPSGNTGPGRVVILKWNGHVWKLMRVHGRSDTYPMLNGVTALSGKLAWAVGGPQNSPTGAPTAGVNSALLFTWNGKAWR